jgi:hypothetical protein
MNLRCLRRNAEILALVLNVGCGPALIAGQQPLRDVGYFLRRPRTLGHRPGLEDAHTAPASTWDRSGVMRMGWTTGALKAPLTSCSRPLGPGAFNARAGSPRVTTTKLTPWSSTTITPNAASIALDQFLRDEVFNWKERAHRFRLTRAALNTGGRC